MTPEPPASSDGSSLPNRHRPSLGNLAKDTTEIDLWEFDDDLEAGDETGSSEEVQPRPVFSGEIPPPKAGKSLKPVVQEPQSTSKASTGEDHIRMNITKRPLKKDGPGGLNLPSEYKADLADLESWQDLQHPSEIKERLVVAMPEEVPPIKEPIAPPVEKPIAPPVEEPVADEDDEFSPTIRENAVPVSLRPHLHLSKFERIGLIALLVLLVGGGATIFFSSLNRLPTEAIKAKSTDFPIKGASVTITGAATYWRSPIVDGPDADTFRRGTELLPVLELKTSGGPATIRIFFRDEEGATVGDAMTRRIEGEGVVKIAATAGFDDPGMHAAYRTGESKPWTVQVLEVTSGDASDGKSRKLFEMNVSTDRR